MFRLLPVLISLAGGLFGLYASPSDAMNQARQAFRQGDFEKAASLFATIPEGAEACESAFYQGLSLQKLGRLNAAIIALQAAAGCSREAGPQLALADAWIARGEDNRAAAALESALKTDPRNASALRALSSVYLRHELNDKAIPVLQSLLEQSPRDAQAHADLGAAYAGIVDYAKARSSFEQALRLDSQHAGALTGLANIFLRTDQAAEALPLLDRAIRVSPGAYEVHFLRGRALSALGRMPQAIEEFQQALKLGGEDPDIYYQLSRAYRTAGREAESRDALARFSALGNQSKTAENNKREAAHLVNQAAPLVEKGDLRTAAELLSKARDLDPANAQLLFRLAGVLYDLKKYDEARASVQRAIELVPSEWMYYYLLGLIDADTNRLESSQSSLETALKLNPSVADVHNALGLVAMRRADITRAVASFEKAVQLQPSEPDYLRNLESAKKALRTR